MLCLVRTPDPNTHFLGSSSWNIYFNDDFIVAFCLVLIEWEKSIKYLQKQIYI